MNKKTPILIIVLFLIGAGYLYQSFLKDELKPNRSISVNEIVSTEMSKVVYSRDTTPNINFVDIKLTNAQIRSIAEWINSVPDSSVIKMNQIPPNISAGIVFRLKANKEVRIQYDLEKIFITRTDVKNAQMYSIEQEELKNFFDQQLKGFYFGNDSVN
ncbi:hypothetical protein CJP46_09750 [Paenibacillus sp. XY044]|nr:hypothetical protein CJP46_09750 [Paenibacillus sp. XY044]